MIFVDTSFFVAMSASDDEHHAESRELLTRLSQEALVTSNHVRGETWTFVRRRYGHRIAVLVLDRLARTQRLRVDFVSQSLEDDALRWLRRRDEREYSFVDATSFVLMRALRIRRALTFDGDFEAAGFVQLRA